MRLCPLRSAALVLTLCFALAGCGRSGGDPTPAPTPVAEKRLPVSKIDAAPKAIPPKAKAVMETRWAGKKLDATVHDSVVAEAKDKGALAAMGVCDHTKVASEIKKLKGVDAGRSSLRLRDPDNAGPAWVQEFLKQEGEKTDVDLKSISEIVEVEGGGEVARFLRRIPVEQGCLGCHGKPGDIDAKVVAHLAAKYPKDKAVGYSVGELRGVVWAEMPVPAPAAAPDKPAEKAATP